MKKVQEKLKFSKQFIRISIILIFVITIILGFFLSYSILWWSISAITFFSFFLIYSGRKQRILFWFQGYKKHLNRNKVDKKSAISLIQKEFCATKYADEKVCNTNYSDIDLLVTDIILKEFKLAHLLTPINSTPESIQKGIETYEKEYRKIKKDIEEVKKNIL
jgi:chaperonin cofactor prefoldin